VTDAQREALQDLARQRQLSTSQLAREAVDAWLAAQIKNADQEAKEAMPQAS